MKRFAIPEFGSIKRAELGDKLFRKLQLFDKKRNVFDWSNSHFIKALNYVGIIQLPGLLIEILPKIDSSSKMINGSFMQDEKERIQSQRNLLYMLSYTRKIPSRDKDLANLRLQKLPLLEALAIIFITRLLEELRKGIDSAYVIKEENVKYLKGKLIFNQHIRRNIAHNERMFVRYHEFISDTWLNNILKAACFRLLSLVRLTRTQQQLREAILYLSNVSDHMIKGYHFEKVIFNRNTERFASLLEFCRILFRQYAPAPSPGESTVFSLLFPMETLFEEFIAQFILRNCDVLNLERRMIHIQAKNMKKCLLRSDDGKGKFRLKPDIVITGTDRGRKIIIDTKWKRLLSDQEDNKNGVSQADVYQLYAYAIRYDSNDNVLLYPKVVGASAKFYRIFGNEEIKLRIEMIDLNRDLLKEIDSFREDLQCVITGRKRKVRGSNLRLTFL